MAFPKIEATAVYTDGPSASSHDVPLPSAEDGDLLLMVLRQTGTGALTVPTGWTQELMFSSSGRTYVLARIADGSEGATVSVAVSSRVVAVTRAISGWYGDLDEGLAQDIWFPGSERELDPSWGEDETLWINGITGRRTNWGATRPTGWTEGGFASSPTTSSSLTSTVRMYDAYREVEADALTPAAWSIGSNIDGGHYFLIGVRSAPFPAVALPILLGLPTLQAIDPGIPVVLFSPTVLLGLDCGAPTFTGTFISQITVSPDGVSLGVSVARALQELDLLNKDIAAPVVSEARVNGAGLSVRLVRVRKTVSGLEVSVSTPDPGPFSGVLSVRAGYLLPQFGAVMDELARVTISRAEISRAARSRDSLLIGTDQVSAEGAVRVRQLRGISFRSVADGKVRIRCKVDVYANPGDMAVLPGGETYQIQEVVYVLTPTLAFMEVVG